MPRRPPCFASAARAHVAAYLNAEIHEHLENFLLRQALAATPPLC